MTLKDNELSGSAIIPGLGSFNLCRRPKVVSNGFAEGRYTVSEGARSISLPLERRGDLNTATAVTVVLDSTSSAKEGVDYVRPAVLTIPFATNQETAEFTIDIPADRIPDGAKTLKLGLAKVAGITVWIRLRLRWSCSRRTRKPPKRIDFAILSCGLIGVVNGKIRNNLIRLNTDGSLDESFSAAVGFDGVVWAAVEQTDHKLIVAGEFYHLAATEIRGLVRLNEDGTLDSSFRVEPGLTGSLSRGLAIGLLSNGKILVGGYLDRYNGKNISNLMRLNPDGSLDETFPLRNGASGPVTALTVLPDDRVYVGGSSAASPHQTVPLPKSQIVGSQLPANGSSRRR